MKNKIIKPLIASIVLISAAIFVLVDRLNLITLVVIGFIFLIVAAVVKGIASVVSSGEDNSPVQKSTITNAVAILAILALVAWYYGLF
jgi:hypothetical protein